MGQIKNIKLHIVTDIKKQTKLSNSKCRSGEEERNVVDARKRCMRTKRSLQLVTHGTNVDASPARIATSHSTQILWLKESRREVLEARFSAEDVTVGASDPKDSDMGEEQELSLTLGNKENEEGSEQCNMMMSINLFL